MSYDRPLQEIANGVIDAKGRFYSFQAVQSTDTGTMLPASPGKRYYIREIDLDGESDGTVTYRINSVSCTIEGLTYAIALQIIPVTIAAVNGVSDESVSYPHVLTDPGTAVTTILASKQSSAVVIYAAVDENQDAKVTS